VRLGVMVNKLAKVLRADGMVLLDVEVRVMVNLFTLFLTAAPTGPSTKKGG